MLKCKESRHVKLINLIAKSQLIIILRTTFPIVMHCHLTLISHKANHYPQDNVKLSTPDAIIYDSFVFNHS